MTFSAYSYSIRHSLLAEGTDLNLGHIQQLLASAMGYNSLAAYQAAGEHFDSRFPVDVPLLKMKCAKLGYPDFETTFLRHLDLSRPVEQKSAISKPTRLRSPNDTYQLSTSYRVNKILFHEELPTVYGTAALLHEEMDDNMEKVVDSVNDQSHFTIDRFENGKWRRLEENDFNNATHLELTSLLEEFYRQAAQDFYGVANRRLTLQYIHVPITSNRKVLASLSV